VRWSEADCPTRQQVDDQGEIESEQSAHATATHTCCFSLRCSVLLFDGEDMSALGGVLLSS